ncbi:MAG: dihydroflavonol 4-reductase [Proteobacteria bacterium SG_bin7]|nr:MAG: dihydroflavonol 4-reductase [Proteobacteria bacterium SG_bin7]
MKVLVTGANGFLGSWLTRRLLKDGHDVFVLVRQRSDLSALDGLKCTKIYGDVTDKSSCIAAFKDINTVFHLAGLVAYSPFERKNMARVNVGGTCNVIYAAKRNSVKQLVYVSSVCAIGTSFKESKILDESSPYNIKHLRLGYFDTKHIAEKLVVRATKRNYFKSVILCPATIYGAGDAKKGSRSTQLKVAKGKFPFYTAGGANVVAVEDVIDGIMAAWMVGRNGERYILSGENLLIKDLFSRIAKAAGVKPPKIFLPNPVLTVLGKLGDQLIKMKKTAPINSEVAWTSRLYHWYSNDKAKKELGFNPRPANVAIENSIKWSQESGLL